MRTFTEMTEEITAGFFYKMVTEERRRKHKKIE